MSDCSKCVHRKDRCFCPEHLECKAYEKEKLKVKHTFEFETNDDWIPGEGACWVECPFSSLIGLGRSCFFTRKEMACPFKK